MKSKVSKSDLDKMDKKADSKTMEVQPTKFYNAMIDLTNSSNPTGFALALRDLCVKYNVKVDVIKNTIDV